MTQPCAKDHPSDVEKRYTDYQNGYNTGKKVGIEELLKSLPEPTLVRKNDDWGRCSVCEVYSSCFHSGYTEALDDILEAIKLFIPPIHD